MYIVLQTPPVFTSLCSQWLKQWKNCHSVPYLPVFLVTHSLLFSFDPWPLGGCAHSAIERCNLTSSWLTGWLQNFLFFFFTISFIWLLELPCCKETTCFIANYSYLLTCVSSPKFPYYQFCPKVGSLNMIETGKWSCYLKSIASIYTSYLHPHLIS